MSDLKLVPPDQPTPFEQQLLDAVTKEAPSAEQRARVRLALGLPMVAPPMASMAPVGRRTLLFKAGAGLIVVSGALALFLALGRKSNDKQSEPALVTQPSPLTTPTAAPTDVAAPSTEPAANTAAEPAPNAVSPLPTSTNPAANPSAAATGPLPALNRDPRDPRDPRDESAQNKRPSKSAPADSAGDLSEQLRLIDAARAAVAARNASAASAALSSYRTRFPRGPFGQEAAVLQIQTLDLQGNHALAATQARSFLARYPNSPHATVVRRIADR